MNFPNSNYAQLYIRQRPYGNLEPSSSNNQIIQNSHNLCTYYQNRNKFKETFECDQYFDSAANQEDLYNIVAKPIVVSALLGYSGTILAYGPTSSGKTFTMRGGKKDSIKGIIPRCLEQLLLSQQESDCEIWVSYFQIYCEIITDLLTGKQKLSVQNDPLDREHAIIKDLSTICISKLEDIDYIMNKKTETIANIKKRLKYENKNAPNTDGHCILTIEIVDRKKCLLSNNVVVGNDKQSSGTTNITQQQQRISTICLVDMAGISRSLRLEEVKAINHSLTVFGECVTAIVERQVYVPYRTSVFTRLLHRYIDQRNHISVIIHVAPQLDSKTESLSALRLGSKVSLIEVYPVQTTPSLYDSIYNEDEVQIKDSALDRIHSITPISNKLIESKLVSNTNRGGQNDIASVTEHCDSIKDLQTKFDSLQNDYSEVVSKLAMKDKEVNDCRQEIDQLRSQPNATNEYSDLKAALSIREKYIMEILGTTSVTEHCDSIKDLQTKLDSLQNDYSEVVSKLAMKDKEVNDCRQEIDQLRSQPNATNEYSDLMAALSNREKYIMEILGTTSVTEHCDSIKDLQTKLDSLQNDYSEVVSKLAMKDKEVNDCRQEMDRLRNQLTLPISETKESIITDQNNKELSEYKQNIEQLQSQIDLLNSKLKEEKAKAIADKKMLDNSVTYINTLNKQLERERKERVKENKLKSKNNQSVGEAKAINSPTSPFLRTISSQKSSKIITESPNKTKEFNINIEDQVDKKDIELLEYKQNNDQLQSEIDFLNIQLDEEKLKSAVKEKVLKDSISQIEISSKQLEFEQKELLRQIQHHQIQFHNYDMALKSNQELSEIMQSQVISCLGGYKEIRSQLMKEVCHIHSSNASSIPYQTPIPITPPITTTTAAHIQSDHTLPIRTINAQVSYRNSYSRAIDVSKKDSYIEYKQNAKTPIRANSSRQINGNDTAPTLTRSVSSKVTYRDSYPKTFESTRNELILLPLSSSKPTLSASKKYMVRK